MQNKLHPFIQATVSLDSLRKDAESTRVAQLCDSLETALYQRMSEYTHGELDEWQDLLDSLPTLKASQFEVKDHVRIGSKQDLISQLDGSKKEEFIHQLMKLHPWRKGPFHLFDIHIDTEWRSDWKWDRLLPHLGSLENKTILDVGCGNAYHCWRMLAQNPKLIIGIDPSQKFLAQFAIMKKYAPPAPIHLLPVGIEHMPQDVGKYGFDRVFSMGVLYHRKSPINHIVELKNLLAPGGELILETLVIDGDENQVLLPQGRYAQMRNVWFIPSAKALEVWLKKCGFKNVRTVDINQTSLEEQRATDWMHFHSLQDYLDKTDINKTIEGHPAPKRAIVMASK